MGGAEQVLCVHRADVFPDGTWDGLATGPAAAVRQVIAERSFFMRRSEVEEDPSFQQVIPYVVFRHAGRYLLTRRLKASSERRLRNLCSLGIGGHINPEDLAGGDPVSDGMRREWEEEVAYGGTFEARPLGLIHEESAPVGRVHLGFVFLVEGDTPDIAIRETHKLAGQLLTLDEMRVHYLEMESWSQLVYDHLVSESALARSSNGVEVNP